MVRKSPIRHPVKQSTRATSYIRGEGQRSNNPHSGPFQSAPSSNSFESRNIAESKESGSLIDFLVLNIKRNEIAREDIDDIRNLSKEQKSILNERLSFRDKLRLRSAGMALDKHRREIKKEEKLSESLSSERIKLRDIERRERKERDLQKTRAKLHKRSKVAKGVKLGKKAFKFGRKLIR